MTSGRFRKIRRFQRHWTTRSQDSQPSFGPKLQCPKEAKHGEEPEVFIDQARNQKNVHQDHRSIARKRLAWEDLGRETMGNEDLSEFVDLRGSLDLLHVRFTISLHFMTFHDIWLLIRMMLDALRPMFSCIHVCHQARAVKAHM